MIYKRINYCRLIILLSALPPKKRRQGKEALGFQTLLNTEKRPKEKGRKGKTWDENFAFGVFYLCLLIKLETLPSFPLKNGLLL